MTDPMERDRVREAEVDEINRVATMLLEEWKRVDPFSNVTLYPDSYMAHFADMARVVIADRKALTPTTGADMVMVDAKIEYAAFVAWWKVWCSDQETPSASSHIFDAWLASARQRRTLFNEQTQAKFGDGYAQNSQFTLQSTPKGREVSKGIITPHRATAPTPAEIDADGQVETADVTEALRLADEYAVKCDWNGAYHAMRLAFSAARALPLPAQDAGWRGIESAPKQIEFRCLLGHKFSVVTGYWDGKGWKNERSHVGSYFPATHWMPLPPAPVEQQLGEGIDNG